MSYGKKDEDADQAIVKVDRTAVFQEGESDEGMAEKAALTENIQPVCSIPRPYRLEDVGYSSPRSPFFFSQASAFPPMRPLRSSSAFRSSSRIRMLLYGRWCT